MGRPDIVETLGGLLVLLLVLLTAGILLGNPHANTALDVINNNQGFISLIFSGLLVPLYFMQYQTQQNQEELMEAEYHPAVKASVDFGGPTLLYFVIENVGKAPAYEVSAEWELAGNEREWGISVLTPGDRYEFPVLVEDGKWMLGMDEVQEYIEESDGEGILTSEITCEDTLGERHEFNEEINVQDVIEARTEAAEIADDEPLEEIASELNKMNGKLKSLEQGLTPSVTDRIRNSCASSFEVQSNTNGDTKEEEGTN